VLLVTFVAKPTAPLLSASAPVFGIGISFVMNVCGLAGQLALRQTVKSRGWGMGHRISNLIAHRL
jgi:hypothetical protein